MKFDPVRALDLTTLFADPDRVDAVASALQSLEYTVHRIPIEGDAPISPLSSFFHDQLLALFALAPFVSPRLMRDHRLAYIVSTLLAFLAFGVLSRLHRPTVRSRSLDPSRRPRGTAPVRVVFTTALDIPRPLLTRRRHVLAFRLVFLMLYVGAALVAERTLLVLSGFAPFGLPILVLAFEVAACGRYRDASRPPQAGPLDNRDGLACLVELARTWNRRLDDRIDVHFHAFGGVGQPPVGLAALHDRLRRTDPDRPTLVVGLWSPGLGPPFVVAANGFDADDPLRAAADGLHMPHEWAAPSIVRATWPFTALNQDFVAILGARQNAPAPAIDAGSLTLAAQLATEVALRWARQVAERQPGVDARARSSQNLG